MKKKIRYLTKEELERYLTSYNYVSSYKDNEKFVESIFMLKDRYLYMKPILSDEFLNTEIDIPQPHILNKEEHDYLRDVCKPYDVYKIAKLDCNSYYQITIFYNNPNDTYSTFYLPV